MKTVLLVEDEAVLRAGTVRGLAKLPGIEVIGVGSMAEAVAVLDTVAPALVISDIDLPDRLGIEILGELGRRDQHAPVIFVTAFLRAFRSQIPRHARVTVFEKPLELERLRAQVTQTLGLTVVGAPAPFAPADYLQLACMGNHSVEIELTRADGSSGRVVVVHGEAWSARDDRGSGEAAFGRLVFANDGLVTCRTLVGSPGLRDLERGWEAMLMDAARALDERTRSGAAPEPAPLPPPPPPRTLTPQTLTPQPLTPRNVTPVRPPVDDLEPELAIEEGAFAPPAPPRPTAGEDYDAAWERGVMALLHKDYARAWDAFTIALAQRPADPLATANLARLRVLGYKPAGGGGAS